MKISKYIKKKYENLKNKIIVITGTTSGLGYETEKVLATKNAIIVCGVRNLNKAEENKNEILKTNPTAQIYNFHLDLTSTKSIHEFADSVTKQFPDGIHALINNAGIFARKKEILSCGHEKHFFTNCIAPIILSTALLPALEKQKDSRIVFISSISVLHKKPDFANFDKQSEKNNIKTYANSKIWLTLYALKLKEILNEKKSNTSVVIAHPGISATSLMDPKNGKFSKFTFMICNAGMKLLFPSSKKACLCELSALSLSAKHNEWISPKTFQVWGYPKQTKIPLTKKVLSLKDECYTFLNQKIEKL